MTLTFIKPLDRAGGAAPQSVAFERSLRTEGLWNLVSDVVADSASQGAKPYVVATLDNGEQKTYLDIDDIRAARPAIAARDDIPLEIACW